MIENSFTARLDSACGFNVISSSTIHYDEFHWEVSSANQPPSPPLFRSMVAIWQPGIEIWVHVGIIIQTTHDLGGIFSFMCLFILRVVIIVWSKFARFDMNTVIVCSLIRIRWLAYGCLCESFAGGSPQSDSNAKSLEWNDWQMAINFRMVPTFLYPKTPAAFKLIAAEKLKEWMQEPL